MGVYFNIVKRYIDENYIKRRQAMKEVTFRPKSSWQKNGCINNSAEHHCSNESTLEAVCGLAQIRCCEDEECKKRAADLACSVN